MYYCIQKNNYLSLKNEETNGDSRREGELKRFEGKRERGGGREKEYNIYTSRNNNMQPPWSYITDKQTETDTYKVASQV